MHRLGKVNDQIVVFLMLLVVRLPELSVFSNLLLYTTAIRDLSISKQNAGDVLHYKADPVRIRAWPRLIVMVYGKASKQM